MTEFVHAILAFPADLVGHVCVIRNGPDQAEVIVADGTAAVIQIRQHTPASALHPGSSALIYDYDTAGEFFWVLPFDYDPDRPYI